MNVYVIIITYNGMQWLPECLKSTKPYPVIVVDNNSTDETTSYIKSNYPEIKLFEQKENLGFGQANNIGMSYALREGADFVFLLNQDAYLFPGIINSLIALQLQNSQYGILSPIHINKKKNRLDINFADYISFHNNPNFISDLVLNKPLQEIYSVPFINAAAWLISKECMEIVGGFDPIFFHYGEDDNYCQRLKFHNFKIGVVPGSFIIHDRENRKKNPSKPYTSQFLSQRERSFKIKFGNINMEDAYGLNQLNRQLKRRIIKALLLGKFGMASYYWKELKMIARIIPEIQLSRARNKSSKGNYLNFST